ncbi:MAG TPA: ATP-binding protein, partial [bacterium]|nr:ATP-binding protein [bacterium]
MRLFLSLLVLLFAISITAQDIPPRITIYNPPGAHPQSFELTQDASGIIYAVNYNGIFGFDGVRWKKLAGRLETYDWNGITADKKTGRIYIGGFQYLGYVAMDSGRSRTVVLNSIVPGDTPVDLVRNIVIRENDVFFIDRSAIFRYRDGIITSQKPKFVFGTGDKFGDRIFINDFGPTEQRMLELVGDSLVVLPYFKNEARIHCLIPAGEGKFIASTGSGIYAWDHGREYPIYQSKDVRRGIRLSDGGFAFRTRSEGVIILDSALRRVEIINEDVGLSANSTRDVMEDRFGNLWVATEDGINKIDRSSLKILQKAQGLKGCAYKIAPMGDLNYIGTLNDLYLIQNGKVVPQNIGRINGGVALAKGYNFASGRGIIHLKKNNNLQLIPNSPDAISIVALDERYLVLGKRLGITFYDVISNRETPTTAASKISGIGQLWYDRRGSVWAESEYGNTYRIDMKDTSLHVYEGDWKMLLCADSLVFMQHKDTIFRYDFIRKSFIPNPSFFPESSNAVKAIADNAGDIWFFTNTAVWNGHYKETQWHWEKDPYYRIHNHTKQFPPNEVYRDARGMIWFLTDDGVLRIGPEMVSQRQSFDVVISRFSVSNDSALIINDRRTVPITLPYALNSVRIEYGATSFIDENNTIFQTWLEGFESVPSGWTSDPVSVYSNLSEGEYVFHVSAMNAVRHVQTTELRFRVLPPWYRTWWAWLTYLMLFVVVVTGLVRWRSYQIMREKERLERIVEERTHLLSVQTQKLEALDAQKSRFFANISHEFRTPLTLLQGPLETMKEKPADDSTIQSMLRNTRRLLRLVNQLLDLSKIEHRQMKLRAYRGTWDFIKPAVFSFESLANKKGLSFTLDVSPDLPVMYRDRDVIEKILFNLLSNAIKFTNEGGVSVKVYVNEGALTIDVEDTGIGISETDLVLIFDRFYQADHSGARAYPGTGIGLALAKELAHLHHGSLTARSRQGKGTVFSFTIPIIEQSIPEDERTESETHSQESAPEWDDVTGPIQSATSADKDVDKNTLLIVEDNDEIRQYIHGIVSNDYHVIEAADGEDGMAEALRRTPDIIISDVMMPRKDGITLSRELKSDRRTSHIPLILLTAKADTEDKIEGLETGADDYLVKPFNEKELRTRVANLIQSRKLLREKYAKEILIKDQDFEGETPDDLFLKELTQLIQSNLSDPEFGVEAISARLAMSRSQVYRKLVA